MIQRIQSLFMSLVVLVMSLNLFSVVWSAETASKTVMLTPFYLSEKTIDGEIYHGVIYIAILMLLVIGITLYSISQFKKRTLQLKLGLGTSVLLCLIVGAFYIVIGKGKSMMASDAIFHFEIGFYLPLIAIVLNVLSNRYIKKDEELVKSVDRLR